MADEKAAERKSAPSRDELTAKAREAELQRQQDVVDAVAQAHEDELPAIGGPLLEPGLGK